MALFSVTLSNTTVKALTESFNKALNPYFYNLTKGLQMASAQLIDLQNIVSVLANDVAARDAAQAAKEADEAAKIVALTAKVDALTAQLQTSGVTLSLEDLALIQQIKDAINAIDVTQTAPVV